MTSRMIDESEQGGRHLQKAKVSLQDFDDIDPTTFMREEDFDDIDDFEKQIDFDADMQTDEKFKNELLFAVQGLGSTKKQYDLEFYMKGPHCEDALKDIIRFCKRDDDDFPVTRIELGKWEVLQKDLIQLLISQVQDKKLTFYLLMLFTQLTEFPKKSCTRRNELIGYLQSYKFAFGTNSNAIHTINIHLSDFFQVEEDERPKIYDQMIEMIVIIYKNLLKVPDNNTPDGFITQRRDLQPKFITTLYRQKTLDAFVFIIQQASPVLMKKLNLYLLEIFYHLFSSFEPVWLFQKTEQDKNLIQQIRDKEKRDRMQRLSEMSTRHARFDCNIKVVRTFNSGSKIIHNPFKNDWNDHSFPNSTKKPKARKFHEKNASIFPNSHDKEVIVSNILDENEQQGSLKQIIRELSVDFVEHAYDKLIENLYEEIHNNPARIEEEDKIYFFFLMAYGLEVFRHHFYSRKENRENQVHEEEYSIASVGAALQLTVFELIQATIMKQVTCAKKSDFSPRLFHSSLYSFLQLLYCVREMRLTVNQIARKSGQILIQKIFSQDNARMLRKGFDHYKPDVHDPKLGKTLAEFIGVFFDLLDEYAKGKVLKIQTNRKLQRNKLKEKKIREKLKVRERKLKEREKRLKQKAKEKEKAKAKRMKEKAKKDKKKKKKKALRIPRGEEDQAEIEKNYEAEVKRLLQQEKGYGDDEAQEAEFTGEPTPAAIREHEPQHTLEEEQESQQEVPATVGTEYTVGSTLQSDFLQTLDEQGGTLETMPTLQPAATFEPTLAEQAQSGAFLENTLAPEEVPTSTLLIEQTLVIADDMEEEQGQQRVTMEEEEEIVATKEIEQQQQEVEEDENQILERKEDEAEAEDEDEDKNDEDEGADDDEDKSEEEEQEDEEDEKISESEIEDLEEELPETLEDEGSDIESNEDSFQYQERIVNFASELAYMADYQVVSVLLNMIRADKLETNNQKINNAVASFMKKIVTVLKADWLFFQIDFLLIFQDILNIQNPKIRVQNQQLFEIINLIVKNFFVLFRKNKLLSVECLFRFADRMTLKSILANYAEPDIEKEAQEDPTPGGGDIGDDWNYRRGTGSLWDEKSDLVLIQNYEDYKDLPDCEAQLCLLFNKMNMNDFSIKDIKKRAKFLRLDRGKLKAQEIFNNIYKDSIRMTIEQALAHSIQLIDPSKFTKDDLVAFLVNVLEQYIDYKQFIGQSIENLHNVDMAIIPLQKKDFDFLEWECIHPLFTSMNFREPRQGESYWRVPGFITINEAKIMIDKLRGSSTIESTIPIDQDEDNYGTIQSTVPIEQEDHDNNATVPATVPIDQDEENYATIPATVPVDQDEEDDNNYATIPATVPIDEDQVSAFVPIDDDDDYAEIPSRMQTQNTDMELDPMGLLGKSKYADDDTGEIEYE